MATTSFAQPFNNTHYYMNPQSAPSPPEAYLYGKGAYGGTISQTPPSANISPTNFHPSHVNVRQLRQPRQPLYIPAALRPTDPPTRPTDIPNRPRAPDTPPASTDNSFDSVKSRGSSSVDVGGMYLDGQADSRDFDLLRRGLSRAASDSLDEELGDVTGTPTTAHWKPDVSSPDCSVCHQSFTWYFRRHHCRRCGNVVCDTHIRQKVPLDQNARLHPSGTESKACDPCASEWAVVQRLRRSRTSSLAESHSSQGTAVPALTIPRQLRDADEARVGSMARSEGMVWSTF